MADLLIAASSSPSLSASPAPSSAQFLPKAEARPAAEPAATPAGPAGASPADASGAPAAAPADAQAGGQAAGTAASFAAVLKKQMAAPAKAEAAVDPLLLAAQAPAEAVAVAEDLSALLPFIEALLPKLMAKSVAADSAADSGTADGAAAAEATAAADPAMLALPLAAPAAVTAASAATADAGAEAEAEPGGRGQSATALPMTTAATDPAIVADDAAPDGRDARAILPGAGEKDFAGLVARAGEGLAASQPAATQRPAEAAPLRMDTPVGQSNWSNELGNKLTWMATAQRQQADLVLNPPQLGRVEVSLTVSGDQASAVFASPNAAVRELLEDSLPRLREILAGAGINLGQAQVGAESRSQFGNGDQGSDNRGTLANAANAVETAPVGLVAARAMQAGRGMVDVFA